MFEKLLSLLSPAQEAEKTGEGLPMATALLLAEAGLMDGAIGDEERSAIQKLLTARFSLPPGQSWSLLERAVTAASEGIDLFSHTKIVKDSLSYKERLGIIEMLWEVVYADGQLHDFEASLMRRVNRLLYVEDQDSGQARKRVLDRLGLS